MKKILEKLISLISLPIMIINTFGGIIAFVWLIILSEWNLIITGIVGLFASAFILGFAFLPALAIQGIGWLIFYFNKIFILSFFYYRSFTQYTNFNFMVSFGLRLCTRKYSKLNTSSSGSTLGVWCYGWTCSVDGF